MKSLTLIIMAAGESTRFCTHSNQSSSFVLIPHKPATKKQWIRLGITPLWLCVTQSLGLAILQYLHDNKKSSFVLTKIIITASAKDKNYMTKLAPESLQTYCIEDTLVQNSIPIQIVCGGETRYMSLKNAMQQVDSEYVIVNDCARFYTNKEILHQMLQIAEKTNCDCVAPYLQMPDTTLLRTPCDDRESKPHIHIHIHAKDSAKDSTKDSIKENLSCTYAHINRQDVFLIQTPQISKTSKLRESFHHNIDFTDETSAICATKNPHIELVVGDKDMGKLTLHQDLHTLSHLFSHYDIAEQHTTLIGQGSDIHGFEDSKTMWLCGVEIESPFGFKAHSDGDVGIHAIIDSLLGAMNYGDIGEIYPDTDLAFKNIDSKILLQNIYDYCLSVGLEIINLDVTIIAQTPRITPYKHKMQECLARLLYLSPSQVSIKASTAEKLGFVGRKEGVFAQSVAQLKAREIFKN